MEVSNATKKENTSDQSASKSSARQSYVKIAEEVEGRKVPKGCDVHHINGNHNDNRPENLLIVTEEMHRWLHTGAKHPNPWMAEVNWRELKKEFIL
jgi:hypothetical protein